MGLACDPDSAGKGGLSKVIAFMKLHVQQAVVNAVTSKKGNHSHPYSRGPLGQTH